MIRNFTKNKKKDSRFRVETKDKNKRNASKQINIACWDDFLSIRVSLQPLHLFLILVYLSVLLGLSEWISSKLYWKFALGFFCWFFLSDFLQAMMMESFIEWNEISLGWKTIWLKRMSELKRTRILLNPWNRLPMWLRSLNRRRHHGTMATKWDPIRSWRRWHTLRVRTKYWTLLIQQSYRYRHHRNL